MSAPTDGRDRPYAVVTGASRGLGAVIARVLAGDGFDLLLTARNGDALRAVASELGSWGGEVEVIAGDVTDPEHQKRLAEAVGRHPGLDLLVNNAATLGPVPMPRLAEYDPAALEQVYRVNVVAPVALVRAFRAALAARGGLVVNISSDAAVGGYQGWGGYGASKAALDLASRTLAEELKENGISVVAVDPGDLRTPGAEPAFSPDEFRARPPPEVTVPFWAWLLGQPRAEITGHRFRAQAEHWGVAP
jgi:NAD(P)-dependent dehydrogenase (short-subunit alcohol dehydrogenase family)